LNFNLKANTSCPSSIGWSWDNNRD